MMRLNIFIRRLALALFCIISLASIPSQLHAQRFTTKGTDFWLAFMQVLPLTPPPAPVAMP